MTQETPEKKPETPQTKLSKSAQPSGQKMLIKLIIGIALIILGLWAVIGWWEYFLAIVRGLIGFILIAFGAITLAIVRE